MLGAPQENGNAPGGAAVPGRAPGPDHHRRAFSPTRKAELGRRRRSFEPNGRWSGPPLSSSKVTLMSPKDAGAVDASADLKPSRSVSTKNRVKRKPRHLPPSRFVERKSSRAGRMRKEFEALAANSHPPQEDPAGGRTRSLLMVETAVDVRA